jgi:hypothetical protein
VATQRSTKEAIVLEYDYHVTVSLTERDGEEFEATDLSTKEEMEIEDAVKARMEGIESDIQEISAVGSDWTTEVEIA